jgi:hypothetical protein
LQCLALTTKAVQKLFSDFDEVKEEGSDDEEIGDR